MAKDLGSWIEEIKRVAPKELVTMEILVDPKWEVTAVVELLEGNDPSPAILFENLLDLKGRRSPIRLLTSIHASRVRLGLTYGIAPDVVRRDPAAPTVEMARRAERRIPPVCIPAAEAPCKERVYRKGASWKLTIEESEFDVIGAQFDEPVRVTPSECWGDKLLVPADAEVVMEGVILPKVREPEAPFSEWTGYYCPERLSHVFELRAITSRQAPIMVNKVMGHHPHKDRLGVYGMEATALKRIREIVPDVIALNLAGYHMQGLIQMRKRREGDAQRAAMALLSSLLQVKHVFIFDEDVDIFNPAEVL